MYNKVIGEGGTCSNEGIVEGIHSEANHICLQCREDLCEKCAQHHKRTKLTANHEVVPHLKLNADHFKALQKERRMFCNVHHGKTLEIYCLGCKSCVCSQCFVGEHQKHECVSIESAAENERCRIKEALVLQENNVVQANSYWSRASEELKRELEMNITHTEENIELIADDLIHTFSIAINRKRRELITKVRDFTEGQKQLLRQHTNSLSGHLTAVKSMQHLTSLIYQHGSAVEIMRHSENLQEKARELTNEGQSLKDESWRKRVWFKKSDKQLQLNEELVGDLLEEVIKNKNQALLSVPK